jgi:hypothetical protein
MPQPEQEGGYYYEAMAKITDPKIEFVKVFAEEKLKRSLYKSPLARQRAR